MYDLSQFAKTLNQRYSQSYNMRHERHGPLWMDRFKSLLLEGEAGLIRVVAAYIDMNPVRAGLAKDPKDFRFCGYGTAMGGDKTAQEGIAEIMEMQGKDWKLVAREYRKLVYIFGERRSSKDRPGFDWQQVKQVLDANGKLSMAQLLMCRVRYLSDGLVLGSKQFVEKTIKANAARLNQKRPVRAHQVAVQGLDNFFYLRPQRGAPPISVPEGAVDNK